MLDRALEPLRVYCLDRLPALNARATHVFLVVVLATACGSEPPRLARTEGVTTAAVAPAPERWCDAWFPAAEAPRLVLPRVVPARSSGIVPALPEDRWVWINVWATWCEPCKREMPLLDRWRRQLATEGVALDVWFVSVDEQEQNLTRFLAQHPNIAPDPSLRLVVVRDLSGWLATLRVPGEGTVPIQLIAAPPGKVRCVRIGALRDDDYLTVKAILTR